MHSARKCYGRMGLISRVSNGITSYNVVRITKTSDNGVLSCNFEILSSEKREWRIVKPENDTFNAEFDMRSSVLYKGNLHWICNKMTTLLAYDPFKNECRFISIPSEVYHMKGKNAILGVSRDNLCYFEMNRISINECKLPGWKMWVMKDYEKGEWSLDHEEKERKIEGISVICNVLSGYSPIIPVSFHPWNEEIVYFWYEGYFFTYNVKKGWFEDDFVSFSSQSIVLMWEMFPLLMPLCPSRLPKPKWDGKIGNIVNK
ncbi:hypothetical protein BUALT_Bualt17G0073200 [Buddleja alternifolia]|uniref:F-box protein At3g26010-like beta-propeller domain-containing protein n=1 Tax=Buddleja alternifolia TaxID=168488 RepID=A0AAV6WHA4_9LAMI|nr:hypothetical protein BUALT_Bualt17G0073200 [Buddleja alternifolia]